MDYLQDVFSEQTPFSYDLFMANDCSFPRSAPFELTDPVAHTPSGLAISPDTSYTQCQSIDYYSTHIDGESMYATSQGVSNL